MSESTHRIELELGERRTTMLVGRGLLPQLQDLIRTETGAAPREARYLLVDRGADDIVSLSHGATAEAALRPGGPLALDRLRAGETAKGMPAVEAGWDRMLAEGIDRTGRVVGLGGGIVCDVAGFIAASWMRGVRLTLVPTTLLAMVDAALGGKTGVNRALPGGGLGKNMVGAFWPADLVVCDTDTLATLPDREFRSGLAECIKHGLIEGEETLAALEAQLDPVLGRDPEALPTFVARSAGVKAGVVRRDFRESGERALLNLGHTYAHAMESRSDLGLRHGEAVAIGLVAAAAASVAAGLAPASLPDRVRRIVDRCGLPVALPPRGIGEATAMRHAMSLDKKAESGVMRLVLMREIGAVEVVSDPGDDVVDAGWAAVAARR